MYRSISYYQLKNIGTDLPNIAVEKPWQNTSKLVLQTSFLPIVSKSVRFVDLHGQEPKKLFLCLTCTGWGISEWGYSKTHPRGENWYACQKC